MGDNWGDKPQRIDVENTWAVTTHDEPSNKYATLRNGPFDDHERPPNRSSSSAELTNKRDLESGPQIVNKERASSSHSREQIRHKDGGDWMKQSSDNGNWKSQNQPSENRDDSPHETRSQKGFDNNNRSSGRPPVPTSDYEQRRDSRNSRPYNNYENDSSSRKPSRAASYDKSNNAIDSHTRYSPSVQDKIDNDEEAIHNSITGKRRTGDNPERWRDDDQNLKLRDNRTESTRFEPTEKKSRDVPFQIVESTVQLISSKDPELGDIVRKKLLEFIVQLVSSKDPELGDIVRKKLFTLGFEVNTLASSSAQTQGRSLLDMGPDELSNYEKHRGNVRNDFNNTRRSQSVSRSVNNDPHDPGNTRDIASKTDNDPEALKRLNNNDARNSTKMEYESQPSGVHASRVDEQRGNSGRDQWSSPKNRDTIKTSVKTPEPWDVADNKPGKPEIRTSSPGDMRRPLEDRDDNVTNIRGSSRQPTSEPRWNQTENKNKSGFRNLPDNDSLRVKSSDSRGLSPNHASRDVKIYETFPVNKQENEDELRSYIHKADPRTASPRGVQKQRDSSISSKVSQPRIESQKSIDPLPNTDTWDSGPAKDDWLKKAALFERQLNGQSTTEEDDKPSKRVPEPWENQKSHEPWETNHNESSNRSDAPKNNGKSEFSANNNSFEDFGNRVEQKDDHYSKSSSHHSERNCYNCNKSGHLSRDCPESSMHSEDQGRRKCFVCKKFGHLQSQCPESNSDNNGERYTRCYDCGSSDHIVTDCPLKTRKPSPFVNPEPSGISPEEAWDRLMKADREQDSDEFKRWLEEFAKASPNATFQTIERKLRSNECNGKIIALKREGIPFNCCLVDLQGNTGKTYVAQPVLGMGRLPRASGTHASSQEENYQWLADAGFMCDDPSPKCFNCKTKGHNTKQCPIPRKESERPGHLPCQYCESLDHITKHCNRRDQNEKPFSGYSYGDKDIRNQSGYNRREHGRSDRYNDNNGAYGNDDRKSSYNNKWGSYENDGRDGNRRRGDYTDDYSTYDRHQNNDNFNKNRYDSSQGSYHNDDKNFNRNRGGQNDGYQHRDFNDQGRYSNQRGNNNNRDRGDFGSRDERNSVNRGYNDFYSKSGREQDNYSSRNRRDRSRDGNRDSRNNGDDITRRWDTRQSNNSVEPVSKKDSGENWDRLKGEVASWNNNSWPAREEEKKNSFSNNNDRFAENQRGRSAQTKEVLASANSGSRNESAKNLSNQDRRGTSNIDNVQAWW